MSQEILDKLARLEAGQNALRAELQAGQDSLKIELLTAIRQSNESTLAAIQALHTSLAETREKVRAIAG